MKSNTAGLVLIILGILGCIIGFVLDGVFLFGVNWIIAGIAYFFADREITDGGLLAAIILGTIGAILWLVVDISRNQKAVLTNSSLKYDNKSYQRSLVGEEDYKCRNCSWFNSSGCKRQEKLINAEPCEDFRKSTLPDTHQTK